MGSREGLADFLGMEIGHFREPALIKTMEWMRRMAALRDVRDSAVCLLEHRLALNDWFAEFL